MRIEYLEYLLEINKRHSISSTARALYMGQTTLSSIVKSVEEELGFPIFRRTPRGIVPTLEGEKLMSLAREIVVKYNDIRSLKKQSQASSSKPVILLTSSSISAGIALRLNEAFLKEEPLATLIFTEVARQEVVPQVFKSIANIGLTHLTPAEVSVYEPMANKYDFKLEFLEQDHFYLLMNRNHRLVGRPTIKLSDIYHENLAISATFSNAQYGQYFSPLFRNITRYTGFPNIELVKQAVLNQNMVSFLTGWVLSSDNLFQNKNFHIAPLTELEGDNRIDVYLIHCNDKFLHSNEMKLISSIKTIKRKDVITSVWSDYFTNEGST